MRARTSRFLVALALAAFATGARADDSPSDAEEPQPKPPQIVVVDFEGIPLGTLPEAPVEASAPETAPKGRVTDLKVESVAEKSSPKSSKKRLHKKKKKGAPAKPPRQVEIKPTLPGLGVLYVAPSENVGELETETTRSAGEMQRMSCDGRSKPSPLRWEKVVLSPDGSAHLQIDDLWFDPRSCALWPGSTSVTVLKPIAWENAKPWLYAVRGADSVTFVMPSSNEINAETMVGGPLTIRGAFTRVTMPLGRWGSGSMFASLPTLKLEAPSPPPKRGAKLTSEVAPDSNQGPVELTVELVQTMAEKYPTLLVRTRDAVASNESID
jgi:hypothetical protein